MLLLLSRRRWVTRPHSGFARRLLLLALSCFLTTARAFPAAAAPHNSASDTTLAFRVFLIGGVGGDPAAAAPVLSLLEEKLSYAPSNSVVVFLGDNVPKGGLPDSGSVARTEAERRLLSQLNAVRDFPGRVVVIPGDHDWAGGRPGGYDAALRQEAFVEQLRIGMPGQANLAVGEGALQASLVPEPMAAETEAVPNVIVPDGGLPGPTVIQLSESVVLIALNTQWWLHPHEKPYGDDADLELDEDFLLELDDLIDEYRDETLLVVGHHPIASSGRRAGRYPLRAHVFPLTEVHPNAYVPLPLVGSLPFLYKRYFGAGPQDLAHPRYASLRDHLGRIFDRHERLIYASAHERSLQYFKTAGRVDPRGHLLVSGSGSGASYTADEDRFELAADEAGFMVLDFYQEGPVWMEAWSVDEGRIYRVELEGPDPSLQESELPASHASVDFGGRAESIAANPGYAAGPLHRFVFGGQYRREWATPIEIPYLDLTRDAGGLTLLRRGGGVQSSSLRFKGPTGVEYVARTVDKDPRRTLPDHLRSMLIEQFVLDFNSSLHPYGALMVPTLADAAGVYHTNPAMRIIPDDPRLGRHREEFAGRLVLFEERPDEDLSDFESFGHSENVIGTPKLYMEVDGDNDHRVDQRAFGRARLLDMLIADWDRHWDQWRWASFEPADSVGKIYRPVPRDRDWAFSRFNGVVPSLTKYVVPHFQGFDAEYGSLIGLNHKALGLDRRFTNELTRSDWIAIADSVREALSDDVIESAVRSLPTPIYELHGAETIRILRARRDALPGAAERHYRQNARVVDVLGSNKHERFEVSDAPNGGTRVVVYRTTKEGEDRGTMYDRTFIPSETKEIRLYGQNGSDQFILTGSSDAIRVRAIGGAGEDRFVNDGPEERPRFTAYDTETGNTWEIGSRTRKRTSGDPAINLLERGYEYDQILPIVAFETNNTEGVVIGGGAQIIRHGFRRAPYAHSHRISGAIATRTLGVDLDYAGHVTALFGEWNAGLNAEYRAPSNVRNFYGLGNETLEEHRTRLNLGGAGIHPFIDRKVGEFGTVRIGPTLAWTRVSDGDEPFVAPEAVPFGDRWTVGAAGGFLLDGRDDVANPKQGLLWNTEADVRANRGESDEVFSTVRSAFSVYATPSHSPQVTLAFRAGGAHIFGDFPFYASATLGGDDNLRGYRSARFAGRSSLYQNLEARIELMRFSTYVAPGHLGVVGFIDNGRVWLDDESSRAWHQTYGGGLWIRVFERFILSGTYGWSDESSAFVLTTGFQF